MKHYPYLSDLPEQNRTDRAYNVYITATSATGDVINTVQVVSYRGETVGPVPEDVREAKGVALFCRLYPSYTNVKATRSIHV